MARNSQRSLKPVVGEVSRIKKILRKVPPLEKQVQVVGGCIFIGIAFIRSGKRGLEISFASNANTTLVAAATRELSTKYALKIIPPHYLAVDGTPYFGEESEDAYRKDLEDSFREKISHEAMAEIIFREYESDIVH